MNPRDAPGIPIVIDDPRPIPPEEVRDLILKKLADLYDPKVWEETIRRAMAEE